MEKGLVYYLILLKLQLKKKPFWICIVMEILLLWTVSRISFLDNRNQKVLLCAQSSAIGQKIQSLLLDSDSSFQFEVIADPSTAILNVQKGYADCAFIFPQDMDDDVKKEQTNGIIRMVSSSFSTKSLIVREKVSAAFFQLYAEQLFQNSQEEIFTDTEKAEEIQKEWKRRYQEYLGGNAVFRVQYETVDGKVLDNVEPVAPIYPSRGTTAVLLFLWLMVNALTKGQTNTRMAGRGFSFVLLSQTATITIPAGVGFAFLLQNTGLQGLAVEAGVYFLFLAYSILFSSVVHLCFPAGKDHWNTVYAFTAFSFLCCPVFWNIGRFLPLLLKAGRLLPPGMYLWLTESLSCFL